MSDNEELKFPTQATLYELCKIGPVMVSQTTLEGASKDEIECAALSLPESGDLVVFFKVSKEGNESIYSFEFSAIEFCNGAVVSDRHIKEAIHLYLAKGETCPDDGVNYCPICHPEYENPNN